MNRKNEYINLLTELEKTPMELEDTFTRAEAKRKFKQRSRLFLVPISSVASFLIVFAILVNCSITFAYACGRIPLIKELAQFVAASPSLSAAVENEYVQPIELEQTENDITVRVEYVIVDQKQLDIFYSLDSKIYSAMNVTPEIRNAEGNVLEGYSISSGSFDSKNGELCQLTVDMQETMPDSMQLILKVYDNGSFVKDEPVENLLTNNEEYTEPDTISEFIFLLKFDPYYTAQGETIELNQTFELDGQSLTVTTVEIYPTHIRLNFKDNDKNTAWLKALKFYLKNEKGKRFEAISNGITATGSIDSPMMDSHRLESSFFSKSKYLTLYITGVTWLDKDMEKVCVNLRNKTAESLPQNVTFEYATHQGNNWILNFSGKKFKKDASYQLWMQDYYDEQGKQYTYNSWSSSNGYVDEETDKYINAPSRFYVKFTLQDYPFDVVYLSPAYSRMVQLDEPIKIRVK